VLFAVLVFGVRWQNRPPETVTVELWEPPAAPRVEPPKPVPVAEPEPPKPEPRVEKPDIAVKEPVKAKPPPRPEPKRRVDETQKRMREELAREQASLERQRAQEELQDLARSRAMATWIQKVQAKIRGNIVLPPDVKGNPEAIFDVVQLPTGEVLAVKLRKSSGHKALDDAIERAILKSSPLPKPDRPELFTRGFELKYHPLD
jgi:colicin import membrane protein